MVLCTVLNIKIFSLTIREYDMSDVFVILENKLVPMALLTFTLFYLLSISTQVVMAHHDVDDETARDVSWVRSYTEMLFYVVMLVGFFMIVGMWRFDVAESVKFGVELCYIGFLIVYLYFKWDKEFLWFLSSVYLACVITVLFAYQDNAPGLHHIGEHVHDHLRLWAADLFGG